LNTPVNSIEKMKLRVAVTDACIFIDLYDLELTNAFFNLDLEVHSTSSVMYELHIQQRHILEAYQSVKMLTIHNLQGKDFIEISSENYPKSLSETDKSVLFKANKMNACVLSSDKILRNCAKNKGIECHGMVWIFDKFVEKGFLIKKEAARKLNLLVATNSVFRNNLQLVDESTPKIIFNHKEHKANTKDTKKRVCITTLCALCGISLCTLWYNFLFYRSGLVDGIEKRVKL